MKIHIGYLCQNGNQGDENQCLGITDAMKRLAPSNGDSTITTRAYPFDSKPVESFLQALNKLTANHRTSKCEHQIFILASANLNHIKAFSELTTNANINKSTLKIVLFHQMSAQLLGEIINLTQPLNMVCMPVSTAQNPEINTALQALPEKTGNKTQVVLSLGVPNTVTAASIAKSAAEYEQDPENLPIPKMDANTVCVILAGDAPNTAGKMQLFSTTDAQALANNIVQHVKNQRRTATELRNLTFIVTNGPRTGKHATNSSLKKEDEPHCRPVWDKVSTAFMEQLQSSCKGLNAQIHMYNFEFNKKSAYNAILNKVIQAETIGGLFIPDESTSMTTECITNLNEDKLSKVITYTTGATNSEHLAHIKALQSAYPKVSTMDSEGNVSQKVNQENAISAVSTIPSMPAAQHIAEKITDYFK